MRAGRNVLLLILLWGCEPAPLPDETSLRSTRGITHGIVDDGDPGVVGLVRDQQIFCTGTLLSERVVVTAAHCLLPDPPDSVFFGAALELAGELRRVIYSRKHPELDIGTRGNDIGVLLLETPAQARTWPLLRVPFDSSFVGRTLRLVGFGVDLDGSGPPYPRKREGSSTISSFANTDFTFHSDPSQTCRGDSGGPAFLTLGGVEYLAGVASFGDPACTEFAIDTRVDAYVESFLDPYLNAFQQGAAATGQRCRYPENCASGLCHVPSDAFELPYCTLACVDHRDCPPAMACMDGAERPKQCVYRQPIPGALGSACGSDRDCELAGERCVRAGGREKNVCGSLCFPNDAEPCPGGYACLPAADHLGSHFCFARSTEGGCAVGGGSRSSSLGAVLFAILVLLTRRVSNVGGARPHQRADPPHALTAVAIARCDVARRPGLPVRASDSARDAPPRSLLTRQHPSPRSPARSRGDSL